MRKKILKGEKKQYAYTERVCVCVCLCVDSNGKNLTFSSLVTNCLVWEQTGRNLSGM